VTDEERAAVIDRTKEIITGDKGVIVRIDEWGKRRLAYEIKHVQEGHYYIMYFEATTQTLAEVTRVLGITDAVLRFMAVRHERSFSVQAPAEVAKSSDPEEPRE
jgi:small subunit ribosomal protein S6